MSDNIIWLDYFSYIWKNYKPVCMVEIFDTWEDNCFHKNTGEEFSEPSPTPQSFTDVPSWQDDSSITQKLHPL